jgi:tRNA-2-methylthio-N6-dimethylallyladenosine synthase
MIVGFPTETDADFEKTMDLVKRVRFDMIYTFIYSKRKFTPAYDMEGQVDEKVKNARLSELLSVQEEISLEKNKPYENKILRVLTDGRSRNPLVLSGRTDSNKLVHYEGDESLIGEYVDVYVERADAYAMYGKIVK